MQPLAILPVGEHMEQQTHRYDTGAREKQQDDVYTYSIPRVQRMVANTTAVRVKNWVSQQMIGINQHSGYHNKPGFFPFLPKKNKRQ